MKNVLTKLCLKTLLISLLIGSSLFSAPIKLKNFRELKRSLELATGVSPNQAKIKRYYEANLSSLPKYGKVEELTAGYLSTYYTLSSFYCEA